MNKRKAEKDSKRQFNKLRKNEFLLTASHSEKPMCIAFEALSQIIQDYMILADTM